MCFVRRGAVAQRVTQRLRHFGNTRRTCCEQNENMLGYPRLWASSGDWKGVERLGAGRQSVRMALWVDMRDIVAPDGELGDGGQRQ